MGELRQKESYRLPSVKKAQVTSWVWGSEGIGDEVKVTIRVPYLYRSQFMGRLVKWIDRTFIEVEE